MLHYQTINTKRSAMVSEGEMNNLYRHILS